MICKLCEGDIFDICANIDDKKYHLRCLDIIHFINAHPERVKQLIGDKIADPKVI